LAVASSGVQAQVGMAASKVSAAVMLSRVFMVCLIQWVRIWLRVPVRQKFSG
jgi:hypothetical protein